MNVIISVNPPYSKMIFTKYKPFDFRKKVLKGMDTGYPLEDILAYIYETKNKGGSGKVIGEVTVSGAYCLHYWNKMYPDSALIKQRFFFMKETYLHWCSLKGITQNLNEGWFKSKKFNAYLKEIGFFDNNDSLNCNYALILDDPILYDEAKPLTAFRTLKGIPITRPPQNMYRVQ